MFNFIRKTALWIILLPLAAGYLGTGLNQLVLNANGDMFPVRINPVKLQEFTGGKAVEKKDGTVAVSGGHYVVLPDGTLMMDSTHCLMTSKTHLNLLADIFDFHDGIESIGDEFIDLGRWAWPFALPVWAFAVVSKLCKKEEDRY